MEEHLPILLEQEENPLFQTPRNIIVLLHLFSSKKLSQWPGKYAMSY